MERLSPPVGGDGVNQLYRFCHSVGCWCWFGARDDGLTSGNAGGTLLERCMFINSDGGGIALNGRVFKGPAKSIGKASGRAITK